ncbi:MAG TPA: hypothetical protein PK020_04945 [Ilumatobacteraceae bacterium]|nr:hypothetical protein [Ilumatobacteraceae bacterium]HRB03962.1 hypothetical protein [Ilumatobacteraceae bacterium]
MQIRRGILDAWLHDLRVGWGERAARSAAAITPIVARGHVGDLHMIGRHFATEGHSLDDVLAWFHRLASRSRAFRQHIAVGGIIELASGWAEGLLDAGRAQAFTPFEVLRLRLHQQVQRGEVLGEAPGENLALVVVETDGSVEAAERVAQHAREAFRTGETMAATPSGKLIILVPRDPSTRELTLQLTESLDADEFLVSASVRVWIEPLAMSVDHIDSHLLGLAS